MTRHVLIAGCGLVGGALARRLVAADKRVTGMKRRPEGLPAGARAFAADLADPSTLAGLPDDVDALVYAASADGRSPEAYRRAYVEGLRNVLDALSKVGAPLERAIFTSSTAVYGQADGSWVDESSPTLPSSFTGEILLEAEALLAERPLLGTSLRLAGIYGPGRDRLIRMVREGRARLPASSRYTNRIHVEDCAGALAHLLSLEEPASIYIGVDDDPAEYGEVISWLAETMGVPAPEAAGADESTGRGGNKRCRNSRLRESGYELRYRGYRDGYREMLEAKS